MSLKNKFGPLHLALPSLVVINPVENPVGKGLVVIKVGLWVVIIMVVVASVRIGFVGFETLDDITSIVGDSVPWSDVPKAASCAGVVPPVLGSGVIKDICTSTIFCKFKKQFS